MHRPPRDDARWNRLSQIPCIQQQMTNDQRDHIDERVVLREYARAVEPAIRQIRLQRLNEAPLIFGFQVQL